MNYVKGSSLSPSDQRHVLAAYVHRFTRDHRPQWANAPRPCGSPYPAQFDSDGDWLEHTKFAVTIGGRLDKRAGEWQSSPTWPDNPELHTMRENNRN